MKYITPGVENCYLVLSITNRDHQVNK